MTDGGAGLAARRHWVFDLDGTLVDALGATALRPGAEALLARLDGDEVESYLWSAGGAAYATRVAQRLGIAGWFAAIATKESGADGRWVLPWAWPEGDEVVCVDDEPGRLPTGVRVVAVRPWLGSPRDCGLDPRLTEDGYGTIMQRKVGGEDRHV